MPEEMKSLDIDYLMQRIISLEKRILQLENKDRIYGPIPTIQYEPIPYWQYPTWTLPTVT